MYRSSQNDLCALTWYRMSFYIHHSIFTDGDKSLWKLDSPSNIDSTVYPLFILFKLLKTKAFQKVLYLSL
ncbi:hypothetical protein ACSBR1_025882 [Camellia fascicularis]